MAEIKPEEVKQGDVVKLKCSGPRMVIESIHKDTANCIWTDKDGAPHKFSVDKAALRKINSA